MASPSTWPCPLCTQPLLSPPLTYPSLTSISMFHDTELALGSLHSGCRSKGEPWEWPARVTRLKSGRGQRAGAALGLNTSMEGTGYLPNCLPTYLPANLPT